MRALLTALCLLCTAPLWAQDLVADLSENEVSITASFDGDEIIVFGAVKHDAPVVTEGALDIIVTVAGPSQAVTVRRKSKRLGIWVNTSAVEVDEAPSFYAVSSTAPLPEILSDVADLRNDISVNRAIRSVGAPQDVSDSQAFTEALIRIRENNALYQSNPTGTRLIDDTLFRSTITLPANLVEGEYNVRIFLLKDREIISTHGSALDVRKVGLERWLYNLAHEQPLIYGLLSLFIAISAGWLASAVFRYLKP